MLFPEGPSVPKAKGVETAMSQDDLVATLRSLKADLAFLEAQGRTIAVRKKDIAAFISKLEYAGASSSSQPADSSGVPACVQLGVLASSTADVPSSIVHTSFSASVVAAVENEDSALVDKSSI